MLACKHDPISSASLRHIRFEPSVNVGFNFKVSWPIYNTFGEQHRYTVSSNSYASSQINTRHAGYTKTRRWESIDRPSQLRLQRKQVLLVAS